MEKYITGAMMKKNLIFSDVQVLSDIYVDFEKQKEIDWVEKREGLSN